MKRNWKNKKIYMIISSVALSTILFTAMGEAGYTDPGSESDPLVTKTYVDKKIIEIKENLEIKINSMAKDIERLKEGSSPSDGGSSSNKFIVLEELKKGEIIIADESTEIIVRSGVTNAIGSKNGGVSDITEGTDLKTGDEIKLNHLLIIPRSDGRGIEVKSNGTYVMIKGGYTRR